MSTISLCNALMYYNHTTRVNWNICMNGDEMGAVKGNEGHEVYMHTYISHAALLFRTKLDTIQSNNMWLRREVREGSRALTSRLQHPQTSLKVCLFTKHVDQTFGRSAADVAHREVRVQWTTTCRRYVKIWRPSNDGKFNVASHRGSTVYLNDSIALWVSPSRNKRAGWLG